MAAGSYICSDRGYLCFNLTILGATAGVTVGAVITVGVVGAAVAALVVFLVARQRRRWA